MPGLGGPAEDIIDAIHQRDAKETCIRALPGHRGELNGGAALGA